MFDMMTLINKASVGDHVYTKGVTKAEGYILAQGVRTYFVGLNQEQQNVTVSLDPEYKRTFSLSLRSVKQITTPTGQSVYQSDPRDIVYGQ